MSIISRIKSAYTPAPVSPKQVAERQLHQAKLDLLTSLQAEEDALANAECHAANAEALVKRIARLQEYLGLDAA